MKLSLKALKKLANTSHWEWPQHTASALLAVLRDAAAGEKELLLAADLAGDLVVMDDELAGAMLALLRNGGAGPLASPGSVRPRPTGLARGGRQGGLRQRRRGLEADREAVRAAGAWSLDVAWEHVVGLIEAEHTNKPLLLAAIAAAGEIRPEEAPEVLEPLEDSHDPDIVDAALEAMSMADSGEDDEEGLEDDEEP